MNRKAAVFPLSMVGAALVCFVAAFFTLTHNVIKPPYGMLSLLLIPALVFLAIAVLAWKGKLSLRASTGLTLVSTLILLILSVLYCFVLVFTIATTSVTDISYYEKIVTTLQDRPGIEAFPETVPDDAELFYTPAFLQGGEVLEISYAPETEVLQRLCNELTSSAMWYGEKEAFRRYTGMSLYEANESDTIYLLWLKGYVPGSYNHGEETYVIVNQAKGMVLFHYSHW
ncbi:MAG: hypothetical protein E7463_11905 [Ruminococcaceae bacterium]|nr:hypothetical protein [Oscillospiraceae bacterium]